MRFISPELLHIWSKSSGAGMPIVAIAWQIAALLGGEDRLDIGARPPRPMDLDTLAGRNALAARLLGWTPQVALPEGLARTIAWHRANDTPQNSKPPNTRPHL